ncbi:SDR family oxidoreductase [Nonlabens antarcticus]|uniref:SDR family oxidoreductase n=1 Tax=Nonlabens antarcticus TaxID=392714 RepID=UPI00189142F9|nr:SDR family oxidoreductase [Nonlabens antarcticus]
MEKVLVVGATGTTGKIIVELLNESQYFEPIAMVRKEDQKAQFENQKIKTVMADLEGDVAQAFQDVDKVVFAAGSGGKKVVEIDQDGAKKMIDAAEKNNVVKFVMLSSRGADAPDKAEDLKDYLWAKHNADEHLKKSKLNYTIVRPGALNNEKGTDHIIVTKKLDQKGEISRADVAQVLTRVLHDDTANKVTFEMLQGDTMIAKALETVDNL